MKQGSFFPKNIKDKGFTLIELLVVISIIGLLSTLGMVALGSARERSRDAKRVADIFEVRNALEMYYVENSSYPETSDWLTLGSLDSATQCLDLTSGWNTFATCDSARLTMGTVPFDPMSGTFDYNYVSLDTFDDDCYVIAFYIENGAGELDGPGWWYIDPDSRSQSLDTLCASGITGF